MCCLLQCMAAHTRLQDLHVLFLLVVGSLSKETPYLLGLPGVVRDTVSIAAVTNLCCVAPSGNY